MKVTARLFLLLLMVSSVAIGCSSSSSSNPATTTTTPTTTPLSQTSKITGSVSAPGATLAKLQRKTFFDRFAALFVSEATAQFTGLQPVPNTNILAFKIDDAGNPVGSLLASTTTDASGNYSLDLPAGTSLSSSLLIQASSSTTPQAYNTAGTLNCPGAAPALLLNPAAQVATVAIIQDIAANGGNLANFTIDEVAAFVAEVQALASTVPAGTSTADTITAITAALSSNIATSIAAISTVGETAAPASIGGTYNIVEYNASVNLAGIEREIGRGTLTLNATNQTFTVSESFENITRSAACAVGDNCQRTFTRTVTSSPVETDAGTYQLGGNGKIVFTIPPSTDEPAGDVVLGIINHDGTLIALSLFEEDNTAFIVAVKEGSGLSASSVADGSTFAGNELIVEIPASGSFTGGWNNHGTEIFTGTHTFTGTTFDGGGTGSQMSQTIVCATSGTGCNLVVTLNAQPITESAGTDPASFTVSSTGLVDLTFTTPGDVGTAHLSTDSNFFVAGFNDPGEMGFGLFVKKGSGLDNTTLTGTYNFAAIDELMESGSDAIDEIGSVSGAITFSGTNAVSLSGVFLGATRGECAVTGSCPFAQTGASSDIFTANGTYTVEADGDFTLTMTETGGTAGGVVLKGTVSADGKTVIFNQVVDNASFEGSFESIRTLGIAFRQ